jgi:hypothetical protein
MQDSNRITFTKEKHKCLGSFESNQRQSDIIQIFFRTLKVDISQSLHQQIQEVKMTLRNRLESHMDAVVSLPSTPLPDAKSQRGLSFQLRCC